MVLGHYFVIDKGGEGCLSRVNTSESVEDAKERLKVSELIDLLIEADDDEAEEQRATIVQSLEGLASLCLRYYRLYMMTAFYTLCYLSYICSAPRSLS